MMPLDSAHVEVAAERKQYKQQQDPRDPDKSGAADRESCAEPKASRPRAAPRRHDPRHRRGSHRAHQQPLREGLVPKVKGNRDAPGHTSNPKRDPDPGKSTAKRHSIGHRSGKRTSPPPIRSLLLIDVAVGKGAVLSGRVGSLWSWLWASLAVIAIRCS
jgi:hypothetical protein